MAFKEYRNMKVYEQNGYNYKANLRLRKELAEKESLEVTLVYAHADTEKKREAINKAMENTSLSTPDRRHFRHRKGSETDRPQAGKPHQRPCGNRQICRTVQSQQAL